ncbi:intracellular exo-alpha-L-arabinofuranosidase 2 [Spirochaetia bacterium]|nr:intracellular exo-alpha-L-arabinofuranosidase 2 [Spirochaetia bacterium]
MNRVVINPNGGNKKISRHIYGHFSEHLGRCIYGGFWVGEDSPIPNVRGIRKDVVAALKKIKVPNLRWPGGCFADEYHWKDGIGPRAERPKMVNTHWGGVTEDNSFGTHEFLDLCEQLSEPGLPRCEPYICGNVGSGTVQELSQWVEYCNFDGISPMADLRKKNGRDAPWDVRFWGIGNESWGCGGNMTPEFYADNYRRYATYARNYGKSNVFKIACGPNDSNYEWTRVLMEKTCGERGNLIDGLSLHYYTVPGEWSHKGSATEFGEGEWLITMRKAYFMDELLRKHSEIMDKYDPKKKAGIVVDEWGTWFDVEPGTNPGFLYQQNSLRDALVAGIHFNIFNNHAERVFMANIAQTINVLQSIVLTEGGRMVLTPTYHVFDMYKVHQDAVKLPVFVESDDVRLGFGTLPAISASASIDDDDRIHVSLTNIDLKNDQKISLDIRGLSAKSVSGSIITSAAMQDHNTFDKPDVVGIAKFNDAVISGSKLTVTLPAKSVVTLEIAG